MKRTYGASELDYINIVITVTSMRLSGSFADSRTLLLRYKTVE